MSEPTVSDQLFGQQPTISNDVASQLFGGMTSVGSVASQLFDDNNGIDNDEDPVMDDDLEPDEGLDEVDESEENEGNEQESVLSQLFGENAGSSVEDQLFGDTATNEPSVHDQLFAGSAEFVEGGFEGPSPEMVIAMLSGLLAPKPVSGTSSVNITFQGPVIFNL